MELTISIAELFLGVWAITATIAYYFERGRGQEFKFRTAVIMKALAEGKATFTKHPNGEYEIVATGKGE